MAMYYTLRRSFAHFALVILSLGTLSDVSLSATALNNVFDTQPIYTPFGSDVFFVEKKKNEIRFHISPFYQCAATARNCDGTKVPGGDRLGQWNMFGVFYGRAANPLGAGTLAALYPAPKSLGPTQTAVSATTSTVPGTVPYNAAVDLTDSANFKPDTYPFAFVSVPTSYEKIGLRSQLNFDCGFGLGVAVKGGVVDVKQKMREFKLEEAFKGAKDTAGSPAQTIYNALFEQTKRDGIASELGLSLKPFHKTSAEDVHVSCYWNAPLDLADSKGETAVVVIPRIAVGVWLPAGEEYNPTQAFSVPTGNNGVYGVTIESSLGFDFPVLPKGHTLQLNVGGGLLLSGEKDKANQRIHSNEFQSGIIPWRTNVTWSPGVTWHMNSSMMADGVTDGLAVFFDFIYTQHLADSITLKTTDATQKDEFAKGLPRTVRETAWKNQQINAGFNYKIAEALSFGGAVQAHISGVRVMRSVTLLGGMTFTF